METDEAEIFETLVFNATLTWQITLEGLSTLEYSVAAQKT
jgi:hypothetical protein